MMNVATKQQTSEPDPAQIRAQVACMTASNVFRNSPQLASFLQFVVEELLRGNAERLKGYTIGVEVLRRDTSFDPQIDPIVRVEATRLRRAIERYYAGPGAYDAVMIALPRGGYVPRISWRTRDADTIPAVGSPQPDVLAAGNGLPTLRVAPFVVAGARDNLGIDGETLRGRLCEAIALFDMINVISAAPAAQGRYDYRLDGTIECRDDAVFLRFRLVDKKDETVIWSRTFEPRAEDGVAETEREVILELATSIAQCFGIIWSHERIRQFAEDAGDPRYRALIQAGEALRLFDAVAFTDARSELLRLIALDPGFAAGYSYLAIIYATGYVHSFSDPGDRFALERALKAARRGVELKPESAFAYHVLFVVLFFRAETEAAIAAAEKAIALNPFDMWIRADYGGRLIFAGQLDGGMDILRDTVAFGAILPSWTHFYLFLGHYLRGEYSQARFHAGQMTSTMHIYGQLARALMAHVDGRPDHARLTIEAIAQAYPRWNDDPRQEIGKLIFSPAIAERLLEDLAELGLSSQEEPQDGSTVH
jgi:tetratricopeptide (TPR) repeat protein